MTSPAMSYCARVISLRCKPADLDEMLTIYRTTSMPMVANLPGLVTIIGAASTETGQAHSITIWETPEDRERGGINTESARNLSLYAPLMVGSYVRDAYDVPVFELSHVVAADRTTLTARMTTHDIEPGHWDEVTSDLNTLAASMASSGTAGYGLIVLQNQAMSRATLIEIATTVAALTVQQIALRQFHHAARVARLFRRPPVTERYDAIDLP